VDLEGGRLLDVVADRTRAAVEGWLHARPRDWLAWIAMVALDPWHGYASALVAPLGHARVVVDHFHAIRLANTMVDQVRRRTQQATLGHRGRRHDPLYRIRKLLLTAAEQLTSRRVGAATGRPYRGRSHRRGRRGLAGQGAVAGPLRCGRHGRGPRRLSLDPPKHRDLDGISAGQRAI
jgi:Transposase